MPVTDQLKAVEAELQALSPNDQRLVLKTLCTETNKLWLPLPGPQMQALSSRADILLYGGSAGGGKSHYLIGCAATEHQRSLILRRQSTELDGLIADSRGIIGGRGQYNSAPGVREWALEGGRNLKFGGCKDPDDWRDYAGRARDFMGFDEAGEFLEDQVASLIAWNRTTDPAQRCRVVFASNPPRGAEGAWLLRWFAPWLEPGFPHPAAPGELRWCVYAGGETVWIDRPEFDKQGRAKEVQIGGETYTPRSRTFIPAKLDDNPYLARTNYRAGLQSLPEPLRSQLLKGDFLAGREDDDWQVIPTAWIEAAQERWTEKPPSNRPMTCMAADVAQGGADETILAARHGRWFAMPVARKGVDTKDGAVVAGLIFGTMRDSCQIVIDLGGGWGSEAYGHLRGNLDEDAVQGFLGIDPSAAATVDGKMGFRNLRAETWWRFREALDPNSGEGIALPPDPKLATDLATPRWKLTPAGILIESKDEIRKRLGRSPDRGDAVTMCWHYGGLREMERDEARRLSTRANLGYSDTKKRDWSAGGSNRPQQRTANLGYAHGRRR